ncbi:MAG: DUF305 domain-containing protein [Thermoleophilia bacterium]|nr:DUF305 domain-containing protein [Thermoleophilia bacterium]
MSGEAAKRFLASGCRLALVVVGALALAGCSPGGKDEETDEPAAGGTVVEGGAPGEEPRELTPEEVEELELPSHTDADVRFMQAMILHHEQALAMTALVPDRTAREDLPLLARRLEISQRDEIARMRGWLEERGEDATHHGDHDHASDVPGMLTAAELAALEAASGRRFDALFLRSMIRHHQGALVMVEQLQAEGGGQEPEISAFTSHVVADQSIEISRMAELLAEFDG